MRDDRGEEDRKAYDNRGWICIRVFVNVKVNCHE